MTLTISMKTASADLADSAITKAIIGLASKVAKAKTAAPLSNQAAMPPRGPALDVTFMLPGKLEKPAFSGMRMGGYESEAETLFFEIAVPEHILHSSQSHIYAATALQDVVANANDFFCDNRLHFNVLHWQKFVNQILASAINA